MKSFPTLLCLKVRQTRASQQNGMGTYRWTALSASRDTGNVGPANFSTSTSEFLTPVSPHSLDLAPVSPFQGGPDLYHLPPAGTKALPPRLVPTSIPLLSTLVTEICLRHIYICWYFHSVHIKPFLGNCRNLECLNLRFIQIFLLRI